MSLFDQIFPAQGDARARRALSYAVEFAAIGSVYLLLAKAGLALASINPSATPIWPPTGFALAAVLIRGYRVAPDILVASFIANMTTAGTIATSLAIASGNMLEAALGTWLINRWAGGRDTCAKPATVARFGVLCF